MNALRSLGRPAVVVPVAYGVIHAAVDATTVAAVFGTLGWRGVDPFHAFVLVVTYDILAFGTQALVGLVTDRLRAPRATAALGLALCALAMLTMKHHALAAVLLAGAGNALFHVGGGALSLAVEPGRASAPGIFVGPGALGLALGLYFGRGGPFPTWPFLLAMTLGAVLVWRVPTPPRVYESLPDAPRVPHAALVVALLLASIVVRSFVGLAGCHAVTKTVTFSFSLATAAFAGKALGGVVADRAGWVRTGVGALLVSAPVLAFCSPWPSAMVFGMFLFQMTMPVTLAALLRVFPRRPAFVFGLACVGLIAGALPTFSQTVARHYSSPGFFGLILGSAVALYFGLRFLGPRSDRPATGTDALRVAAPTPA